MDSLDSSSRSSSSEDIEFLNRNRDRAGDNNHDGDTIENLDNDNDAEQPVVAPPPNPEGSSSRAVGRQANGQGGRGGASHRGRGGRGRGGRGGGRSGGRGRGTNANTTQTGPSLPPGKPDYVVPARWSKPQQMKIPDKVTENGANPLLKGVPKKNMAQSKLLETVSDRLKDLIDHVKKVQPKVTEDYKSMNDTTNDLFSDLNNALDTIQTLESHITALEANAQTNYLLAAAAQGKQYSESEVQSMRDSYTTALKSKEDVIAMMKKDANSKSNTIKTLETKDLVDHRTQAGIDAAFQKHKNKEQFKSDKKAKDRREKLKNLKEVQSRTGSITTDRSWNDLGMGNRNSSRKKKSSKKTNRRDCHDSVGSSSCSGSICSDDYSGSYASASYEKRRKSSRHKSSRHKSSRHGSSRHGSSRHESSRRGSSSRGSSRHGSSRHESSRRGSSRHGRSRRSMSMDTSTLDSQRMSLDDSYDSRLGMDVLSQPSIGGDRGSGGNASNANNGGDRGSGGNANNENDDHLDVVNNALWNLE